MYPERKRQRVYVLSDGDRERIEQMILALRCALDVVFDRRGADLNGSGTVGNADFDRRVDEALWAYLEPDDDLF